MYNYYNIYFSVQTMTSVLQALKKGGHVPYRDSKLTRLLQVLYIILHTKHMLSSKV